MPVFPNKWIPTVLILISGIVGFIIVPMQSPADWAFHVKYPGLADDIRRVSFGMVIGVAVWMGHRFLLSRLEKFIVGWLRKKFGNSGDTEPPFPVDEPDNK